MSNNDHVPRSRIPVTWNGSDGALSSSAGVITATEDEVRRYSESGHVCGECEFFEPGHGQHEIKTQRFMERLVREFEWKPRHLCTPEHQLGLCGQTEGTNKMLTGPMHAACDQFCFSRGRLRTIPGQSRRVEPQIFDLGDSSKSR